jgi:IS1 family transposase
VQELQVNRLSTAKRVQVVSALVEGVSTNATCRMTGVAKHTVLNLLRDLGCAAAAFHHRNVRGLKVRRLQADEIWAFVGAKKKNVTLEQKVQGWGDVWTWVGIDADTKLVVSYLIGDRGKDSAFAFILDCAERIVGRPQLTTDALKVYPDAVEEVFGSNVDYAQLHKIYGAPTEEEYRRCSPARCIGCDMKTVVGDPDPAHVSTSYVERSNLTMRMSMRRFTRPTNGFSKKLDNHGHAVALYFLHYNFCRVHQTLRVTPAMEAGLANHAWTIEELISLLKINSHHELAV